MSTPPEPVTRRSGRPRDPHIDRTVLDATLDVLDEHGYADLTIEEVVRRAGTSKPSLYRRWPTRRDLVLAALARRLGEVEAPSTGCTLCDLHEAIKVFLAAFRRTPPDVLAALFADCAVDQACQQAFMTTLFAPPRAAVAATLEEAFARGDLRADVDRELALDLLASFIHFRAMFRHASTSDDEIERAVVALLQGIATDYPALLERSRALAGEPSVHGQHS